MCKHANKYFKPNKMPKRIRKEQIYIAPSIIGYIQENGNYYVFDEIERTELNPENILDKIKIYERQVKGWFLEPTLRMVRYKPKNKGFLVLMSCLSYFEGVEQYRIGTPSNGNAQRTFINAINRMYPELFNDLEIRRLYIQARCGLFHDGMTKGQIIINSTYENSIEITNNDIKINPKKLLQDITNDFETYLAELRNDVDARNRFNNLFSNI